MGIGYLSFILTMVYKKKFRFTNATWISCVVVVRRSVKEQRGPMRFFIILSPIPHPSCVVLRTRLGDLATTHTHPSPPWLETWCCLVPGLVPRLVLAGVAPPSTSCRHFPTLDIEYSSIIPAWARTNQQTLCNYFLHGMVNKFRDPFFKST